MWLTDNIHIDENGLYIDTVGTIGKDGSIVKMYEGSYDSYVKLSIEELKMVITFLQEVVDAQENKV